MMRTGSALAPTSIGSSLIAPDARRGEVILIQSQDGQARVGVQLAQDTVWQSLDQMATLSARHNLLISRPLTPRSPSAAHS